MKKTIKKIAALLLAGALATGMNVVSFADDTNPGSITITNASKGQTYDIYRVFDFELITESTSGKDATGVYKLSSKWSGFTADGYFTINANDGTVVPADDFNTTEKAAAFAALALEYAEDNNIANDGTQTPDAPTNPTSEEDYQTSITFNNLPLGYYLVDTTLGALCSLDTTAKSVNITEKNDRPNIDKTVEEDSTKKYGANNDAEIGQIINYQSKVTLQPGMDKAEVYDTMDDSLDFVEFVSAGSLVMDTDYTVETAAHGFTLKFKDTYLAKITASTEIVLSYTGRLNENAKIADEVNVNEIYLRYNNDVDTIHHKTETKTYKAYLLKYAAEDTNKTPIAGAKFTMKNKTDGNDVYFTVSNDGSVYTVCKSNATGATTEIVSVADKKITFVGLDNDTYTLTETEAPSGRKKIEEPQDLEVTVNNTAEWQCPNGTGTELPSTGGMGTTIFYVIGGLLILAAAIVLITKKRVQQ